MSFCRNCLFDGAASQPHGGVGSPALSLPTVSTTQIRPNRSAAGLVAVLLAMIYAGLSQNNAAAYLLAFLLISLASVRLLARENERSRMNHVKSEREIGVSFRPFDETLADIVAWYRGHGELPSIAR